jgi:hypothetical protein
MFKEGSEIQLAFLAGFWTAGVIIAATQGRSETFITLLVCPAIVFILLKGLDYIVSKRNGPK